MLNRRAKDENEYNLRGLQLYTLTMKQQNSLLKFSTSLSYCINPLNAII